MNILLTNDDGINAEGIRALVDALKDDYDVYVVAPDKQNSATSHHVTFFHTEHKAIKVEIEGVKEAWAIEGGTPADSAYYALNGLINEKIDLVISMVESLGAFLAKTNGSFDITSLLNDVIEQNQSSDK